ncbi:hypothetical protein U1Q18_013023, partial [Sarracenia purpurea var. burkii]
MLHIPDDQRGKVPGENDVLLWRIRRRDGDIDVRSDRRRNGVGNGEHDGGLPQRDELVLRDRGDDASKDAERVSGSGVEAEALEEDEERRRRRCAESKMSV